MIERVANRLLAVLLAVVLAGSAAAGAADLSAGNDEAGIGIRTITDLAYGDADGQRLDVYLPPGGAATNRADAPILVMVHGGAWMFGDKTSRGVVGHKLERWVANGWILVAVNTRLVPRAGPAEQADDVARAVAFVQRHAAAWGGDADRLVLMGHSAGAHLVALLSAAPARAAALGVRRWPLTVALDSAALDVAAFMSGPHSGYYDRAFGRDAAGWAHASPTARLAADATPMLLVCSTVRRAGSCSAAHRFAAKLRSLGVHAEVLPVALRHIAVDAELGLPGAYSDAVDAFIAGELTRR